MKIENVRSRCYLGDISKLCYNNISNNNIVKNSYNNIVKDKA